MTIAYDSQTTQSQEHLQSYYDHYSYLQNNIPRYKRSLLAQCRTGVLPLRTETGRFHLTKDIPVVTKVYRKINIEERTCLICNSNAIED